MRVCEVVLQTYHVALPQPLFIQQRRLKLDDSKNIHNPKDQDIVKSDSTIRVLVVQTQKDWEITQECWRMLNYSMN